MFNTRTMTSTEALAFSTEEASAPERARSTVAL